MIITKTEPFTEGEIGILREYLDPYIKTVIDIKKRICCAGMKRHFEGEQLLLQSGSVQNDLWGGGIDIQTKEIDFSSMINIRPRQHNSSHVLEDRELQEQYRKLTEYFFANII